MSKGMNQHEVGLAPLEYAAPQPRINRFKFRFGTVAFLLSATIFSLEWIVVIFQSSLGFSLTQDAFFALMLFEIPVIGFAVGGFFETGNKLWSICALLQLPLSGFVTALIRG
jgi:hypothetical protein